MTKLKIIAKEAIKQQKENRYNISEPLNNLESIYLKIRRAILSPHEKYILIKADFFTHEDFIQLSLDGYAIDYDGVSDYFFISW